MDVKYLSITEVAEGFKVMPEDILKWIGEGKIRATKINDTFQVSVEEYQRYGKRHQENQLPCPLHL